MTDDLPVAPPGVAMPAVTMPVAEPAAPVLDFRALFEGAPDLYLVLTPSLRIVAASDAYCRATLIQRDAVIGRQLFDVFPDNPDDPAADGVRNLRASLVRALQFRRPDVMPIQKYDIRRPDAEGDGFETRYWAPLNTPVLNAAGEIAWLIHRVEDVTESMRLQAEGEDRKEFIRRQQGIIDQLRSTKRFLDAVVDNLPGMLFVKSYPDCRFVLFNRAGEELLGYPSETFLGKTDYDFFPREQADHFVANDRAVLEAGIPALTTEEPIDTRYQGQRILRTIKVPVMDPDGKPEYLLGFSEDITEKKTMEQQLRQAVKMEAIGQLTGGIAHDFNNLLSVVIGNLDMALEGAALDSAQRELIGEALNGALKGAELTRRLLAFSRTQPLQPTSIDLNHSLPQIAAMLRRILGDHIEVELHPGDNLWPAMADAAQVDEAVLNLAINARDAMPKGGKLTIETMNTPLDAEYAAHHAEIVPGDYVQLAVSDTGIGMSPEVIEHCFEPFFTTKDVEKGTGLGLSMVYGFVKQSGGHIKLYSELGHGTSVKLYFPRAGTPSMTAAHAATEAPPAGAECVLVVEDRADLRAVTVKQLADFGYRTLEAENARGALAMLAAHPEIQLIFSDIVMPGGMTGTELAREAHRLYPRIKILLTSGYTARAAANGFHDIEGLDLLLKPFRKADLARRLRALLDAEQ
ncbi:PAS domain-containing protein [Dongia sp.]|uniref:hybrid sensor histidine kinase/response regulator n=1 Tax=Dongia sp. TaxID=1977262 RepID=UPI0035B45F8D